MLEEKCMPRSDALTVGTGWLKNNRQRAEIGSLNPVLRNPELLR